MVKTPGSLGLQKIFRTEYKCLKKRNLIIYSFHIFPHYCSVTALAFCWIKSEPLQTLLNKERRNMNFKSTEMGTSFSLSFLHPHVTLRLCC